MNKLAFKKENPTLFGYLYDSVDYIHVTQHHNNPSHHFYRGNNYFTNFI